MSTPSASECFAANVRRELDSRNWTQTELAKRIGLPPSRIAEVVSGRFNYRITTIERIAEALGVMPAALLLPPAEKIEDVGLTSLR